jgi:bacterioferritin-associated ferredoxin
VQMDTTRIADETQICRCEQIRADAIRQAIADGATTINDVKRRTRAGMGVCQGIYCTRTIAGMIHDQSGVLLADLDPMTARPPSRLVPLAQMAASEE